MAAEMPAESKHTESDMTVIIDLLRAAAINSHTT